MEQLCLVVWSLFLDVWFNFGEMKGQLFSLRDLTVYNSVQKRNGDRCPLSGDFTIGKLCNCTNTFIVCLSLKIYLSLQRINQVTRPSATFHLSG